MSSTLSIALQNQTTSSTVYAYITGLAIDNSFALFLLQSDGVSSYFPSSPPSNGTPLAKNCAIALGNPGSTRSVTIPRLAGARVWFSIGTPLTFLLNPGPGLVEPSVTNPSDPNINTYWGFCEFTFNSTQLFANISYVDFVSIPISMTLTNTSGGVQHVSGMPANGLDTICAGLIAQNNKDGAGWNSLIVQHNGANLRALSPNNGIVLNSNLFSGYWQPYINQIWSRYTCSPLSVNTQAQWGTVQGSVVSNLLTFNGVGSFAQPSARDIFSCSTGPFAGGSAEMGALTARISAGFNRSTILFDNDIPSAAPSSYYQNSITNHYARIVHAANLDGRGYAFPYDDVGPSGGADQSGSISDGAPKLWTIAVGGGNATATVKHGTNGHVTNGHVEL